MSGQSLGLIETVGLAVAVEAADAAMKSVSLPQAALARFTPGRSLCVRQPGLIGLSAQSRRAALHPFSR